MIIVLSAWRGPTKDPSRKVRALSQERIDEACTEVVDHLLRNFVGVTIRYGDCPTGGDAAFHRLLSNPRVQRRLRGHNSEAQRFVANWDLPPKGSGGPIRNRAMLDGDRTFDPYKGVAHQLIALPEPGGRKERSGTWDCIDAAIERMIPIHLVHLGNPAMYTVAGLRRTRMPLITPQDKLTIPLEAMR